MFSSLKVANKGDIPDRPRSQWSKPEAKEEPDQDPEDIVIDDDYIDRLIMMSSDDED